MRAHMMCLALIFLLMFVTGSRDVHAQFQNQTIELSANEGIHDCSLYNEGPKIGTVYVRLLFNIGATGARFRVAPSAGVTLSYLSETHPFAATLGNTQTGISICLGECVVGNAILATISYMSFGTGPNCGLLSLVPHPDAETVEVLDCDGLPQSAWLIDISVPISTPCGCPAPHILPGAPKTFNCAPLAVEASTWGAIKALYRD